MMALAFLIMQQFAAQPLLPDTAVTFSDCGSCWSVTRGVKWASKMNEAEAICAAHTKPKLNVEGLATYEKEWQADCSRIDQMLIEQVRVEQEKDQSRERRLVHDVASGKFAVDFILKPHHPTNRELRSDDVFVQFPEWAEGEPIMCAFSKKTEERWAIPACTR